MARIRTIKPEFPQSESMGRVSREARYCFILLWTLADDAGRLRGNSRMLASLLYPYDDDASALVPGWLAELEAEGCVKRYEVEGASYVQIANWLIHQKIDKPSESKLPSPREDSRTVSKPTRRTKEGTKERTGDGEPDGFASFWSAYPRKQAKAEAQKAFDKLAPDDELRARIVAALVVQARTEQWQRDGGKFIPHAASWLNGKRWLDEPAAMAPAGHEIAFLGAK